MTQRMSARLGSLRRRAASSAASFDAPSSGACDAGGVLVSRSSSDALPVADRRRRAQDDASEGGKAVVAVGEVEWSTDSGGVHVGLSVHSGQAPAGPVPAAADRSTPVPASPLVLPVTTTSTTTTAAHHITVWEHVCTLDDCAHCCGCHLRHSNNGYGRCMQTARRPWPDCECAGQCPAGRCAQFECAGSTALVLASTTAHPCPSAASSPGPPDARGEAGSVVCAAEEACTGPQAGARTSAAAAYCQPSAPVSDSGSAVGQQVAAVGDGSDSSGSSSSTNTAQPAASVPVKQRLPAALLAQLPSLSHQPRRLPTIADGRCSVASVLLARGTIQDAHTNEQGRAAIDAERRRLGRVLRDEWGEAEWVRRVPVHVRGAHMPYDASDPAGVRRLSSHTLYCQLLLERPPTEWLDHGVFYVAAAEYAVGVFVMHQAHGSRTWLCTHINAQAERHIVLYHACGHYEAVQCGGLRLFPSDHELVARLSELAARHPAYPYEEDGERTALTEHEQAHARAVSGITAAEPGKDASPASPPPATPTASRAHVAAERATPKQRGKQRVRRAIDLRGDAACKLGATTAAAAAHVPLQVGGMKQPPALLAQVAQHGPLYERVSFHNVPQWRAANEPLWNAYRLASMTGQRSKLAAIVLDILLLPQRVLPKLGRSGRAARRRAVAATGHRLRSEAERLRARYDCPDPDMSAQQRAQMSVDTMAHTAVQGGYERPRRAASIAAAQAIRAQAADTTDAGSDTDTDTAADKDETARTAADSDDECDEPFPTLRRQANRRSAADPDSRAARRADELVQCGLTRKAAQVLHSTTSMADLRTAEAQEAMLRLHPRQPSGTVLPPLPHDAPPSVLEDDADMRRLLVRSDNGTAAGPSGWGGNMLSSLAQSDICRLGILALLRDIINGELPDDARQLLLASRLVALAKPSSDSYRPIAVGEQLYRLAAIVAAGRVSAAAASLLAPHQYGVGVAAGAEKIVHSLQHELADTDKRAALLQLDMANAFNSCDRARLLSELYALPELQSVYRIADFAYSQPSTLVLSGCDGQCIQSQQGVRQGDPLSALLFCVYMRRLLERVAAETGVRVYGFFDDVNLLGTPQQLMAALGHLQRTLPEASLQLNTAKSHFVYFHDLLTPLSAAVRDTLSAHNIECHHRWAGVVGAVVGRDEAAIRDGMRSVLSGAGGHDAFFRRLQLDDMPLQTAMLLLRACMVPSLNYHLRCVAPSCIEDEARLFDQRMLAAAMDKLGLDDAERTERTATLLQRKLRDGGWGLTPAVQTSPAAYLASLAACYAEPSFAPYSDAATPLLSSSLLYGWLDDSMQRVGRAAEGEQYRADIESLLPATAGVFFAHYSAAAPSTTITALQRTLTAKATQHRVEAANGLLKSQSRGRDKWAWAHQKAITRPGAAVWKAVRPDGPHLRLADSEFAIAARQSLALHPFPARAMSTLPDECPLCRAAASGGHGSLRRDPWHFLSCHGLKMTEVSRRHNAVADSVGRVAGWAGAQVVREVKGLDPHSNQRPDLQLVFPGRMLLTDVVVCTALTPGSVARDMPMASKLQGAKQKKYAGVAARLGAQLLNVSVEAQGGMASETFRLAQAVGEEGERWSAGTWSSGVIERQLLSEVAIAVQRGNALAMLSGYTRALRVSAMREQREEKGGEDAVGEESEHE